MAQIHELIGKAMKKIGAIGKDSNATNMSGKLMYKFRGIDAVYNALNPVMAELGLFVCPEVMDQKREERRTANGGLLIYSILTVKFTVYAPDGSSVEMTITGEGMDSGDKSSNKAMSAALKYAMFQLFMIPTEEMKDPDADVYDVAPKSNGAAPAPVPAINPEPKATVTKSATVPSGNPAMDYLANELKFMCQSYGLEMKQMKAKFGKVRTLLISRGTVKSIPYENMTIDQVKELISAFKENCPPEAKSA